MRKNGRLIWSGIDMDYFLQNYRYVKEYDRNAVIPESLIDSILQRTWKITPSKNNFMPYKVHVIGPKHQELKDEVYLKCLKNEEKSDTIPNVESVRYSNSKPNFWNIISCSYLLIFTQRVEDKPNPYQEHLIKNGFNYEQVELDASKSYTNAVLEIGMFANNFSALCLEHDLDVSYTLCIRKELSSWKDKRFKFLKQNPIFVMTIGKGLVFRQDTKDPLEKQDLKPDYERIVNFVNI